MFNDLKPRPDLVRSTALDDVLVQGEDDVRCQFSCPCVQFLGQSVFLKPLVPVGERAGIDFVLFREVELSLDRKQLKDCFLLDSELLKRDSRLSLEE